MPEFMHCCSGPISIYRLALEAKQGRMARRKKKHGAYNENLSSLPLKEPGVLQPADKVKSFFGTVAKLFVDSTDVLLHFDCKHCVMSLHRMLMVFLAPSAVMDVQAWSWSFSWP
nr:uncharacterized protein LOC119176280 isoform X1 [Rhipicephalus microplus]XP_037283381.1 uncharacterized protein LOC119176280 isoform X1 [Rhipicephalus microplus]